ncbi:MAG: DUF3299 domain-containing protein [Zoogloeaceae bacterium]|jgi:hypothetical protein|nr:DUF3299 domain-containing protein [Zoogloeaceae bacterium]
MPITPPRHARRSPLAALAFILILAIPMVLSLPTAYAAEYPEISWDDLIPADWDPAKSFQDLQDVAALPDSDARVQELYERMRKVWDEAPTVPALAGRAVRLPGYLVPLDMDKQGIREFLLVPYFGACIHTPPPPANQIIHVRSATPIKGLRTMDAVWVSGKLEVTRSNSVMGISGYRMTASKVVKYK